jgi:micrococcal nuclease
MRAAIQWRNGATTLPTVSSVPRRHQANLAAGSKDTTWRKVLAMRFFILLQILTFLVAPSYAPASELDVRSRGMVFDGPYQAEVLRVIDGDTIVARIAVWPGLIAEYSVRVRGSDAPEIRRPDCEAELEWGMRAKEQVERLYPPGSAIRLRDVQFDIWSGRVLADVQRYRSDRWLSLSSELLQRDLAVEWEPSQGAVPWCLLAQGEENDPPPVPRGD